MYTDAETIDAALPFLPLFGQLVNYTKEIRF